MPTDKVRFGEKFAYGFGDLASVLYWQTFMAYIFFFYTDVFGMTAAATGTMLLVTRLWDGVNDPMMGVIADRTETRWGKFRPFLLWLCVPFALIGVLTFSTPDLDPAGKVVYAYVTFTLMMMVYTAINIPYSALLGVISSDPAERAGISSIKFIFAYFAGVIVSLTLLPMAKWLGGGGSNDSQGWQLAFVIYGIAAILFFLIAFRFTQERVQPIAKERTPIGRDLKDLFANKAWVTLLLTTITMILFIAGRMTVTVHYFKYYVGEQQFTWFGTVHTLGFEWTASLFNWVGQLVALVGVVFAAWFARHVGTKRAFMLLLGISVASTAAFFLCQPNQLMLMMALQVVGSFTGGPLSPLIWAMYTDAADYGEWKTGRRATGLVFSASTMSQKFGWAIGAAFAGWLLGWVGFQPDVEPSDNVLMVLRLLMSLIPAALGVLCLVPMFAYRLDAKQMKTIQAELTARRRESDSRDEHEDRDQASDNDGREPCR